ncbi:uncharacterized protein [Embiotoca jacksoni]|uniref:uncharacterized protein n=1 Tax=Embiotoca jacksoni TaxID=100190 RepID=UPI0037037355
MNNLTILRTVQEDEGMYHCTNADFFNTEWNGTYLLVKGNSQTSNYTVTQWPTASGPGRDSATLQCSILSDPEHMKCPGHHSVFWFRVGSDESHPDTIFTDGNRNNECDEESDAQKSCVYRFSKNIISSDAGTYYCAVTTCGRILFGNISKLHLGCMFSQEDSTVIFLLCAVLAISLIVIAVFIHAIKKNKSDTCRDTLVPITTVQIGEPVTLTCSLLKFSSVRFQWYKQSAGDNLKLIVKLWTSTSEFEPEFPQSRFQAHLHDGFSNLTILRTVQEDEGMYHCASTGWINTAWTGTYLLVKGNSQTSNYTVTQWLTASGPGRDSATLQCSILSDPEHMKCPGHHNVFWFRVRSDESHPDTIYTDGNRNNECDEESDAQKSCVYRFSKNISSSDAGTYYCAVATCGRILFGNISKLHLAQTTHSVLMERVILIVCLAISVIGNVVLICKLRVCEQRRASGTESALSEAQKDSSRQPIDDTTEAEHNLNYAPLNFSERKATRGRKKREFAEDCVYSQVKH